MQSLYISNDDFLCMSLQNFVARFPSEEACVETFQPTCKRCSCPDVEMCEGNRSFICNRCKAKTWRTAGTFFEGLHTLVPTFAAIWLHEDRAVCSRKRFAEIFNISYANAWEIFARVQSVIDTEMDDHDAFDVVSTHFDPIISKRSIKTFPDEHPRFEEVDDVDPEEVDIPCEKHKKVYLFLSKTPISFDALHSKSGMGIAEFGATLSMLEICGWAQHLVGNRFVQKRKIGANANTVMPEEENVIQDFIEYVKNFHGISRKYLQRYIASFWSLEGVKRWRKGTLLWTCMGYGRVQRQDILGYHSPNMVRMACR